LKRATLFKIILELIGFIVTLYGLLQIIMNMGTYEILVLRYIIISILIIAIVLPLVYRLTRPPLLRDYNLQSISKEFIVTKHHIGITIQKNGSRAETKRNYVFIKKPKKGELFDLVEATQEMTPQAAGYSSQDSEQIDYRRCSGNKLSIYWKPKGEPTLYTVYPHMFLWTPSAKLDDNVNYFSIFPTYLTGETSIEIQTHRVFNEVLTFATKKRFKDEESVYRYAIFMKRTNLSQPSVDEGGHTVRLAIKNPKPGTRYFTVWSHEKSILNSWLDLANKKAELGKRKKYITYFSFDYYRLKKALNSVHVGQSQK